MHRLLLPVFAAALFVLSCGGGAVNEGNTARSRNAKAKAPPEKVRNYEDENNVGMSETRVSRWRWKGDRKQCYYVVGNRCFTTERAACKAAKCRGGAKKCVTDNSAPVNVSCKK